MGEDIERECASGVCDVAATFLFFYASCAGTGWMGVVGIMVTVIPAIVHRIPFRIAKLRLRGPFQYRGGGPLGKLEVL